MLKDRGARHAAVRGAAKSRMRLSRLNIRARIQEWVAVSSPVDLPKAGFKPTLPAWQVDLLSHLGSPSYITYYSVNYGASLVALVVKNLPVNTGDARDPGSVPGLG